MEILEIQKSLSLVSENFVVPSIQSGRFLDLIKTATVSPVFKTGYTADVRN